MDGLIRLKVELHVTARLEGDSEPAGRMCRIGSWDIFLIALLAEVLAREFSSDERFFELGAFRDWYSLCPSDNEILFFSAVWFPYTDEPTRFVVANSMRKGERQDRAYCPKIFSSGGYQLWTLVANE